MTTQSPDLSKIKLRFPEAEKRGEAWIKKMLNIPVASNDRDYFNQWTTGPEQMSEYQYSFFYDPKWHWIVKHPNGQDQVMDPELWAKMFRLPKMEDGLWYLGTDANDAIYGNLRMAIEVAWADGMVRHVSLVAPDGDPVKRGLQRFNITRTELL